MACFRIIAYMKKMVDMPVYYYTRSEQKVQTVSMLLKDTLRTFKTAVGLVPRKMSS